jgi:hypothetical protein
MDFAKRRAELQAAMDLNAISQGELANEMRTLQREFRQMELQELAARANMRARLNPPTGVMK